MKGRAIPYSDVEMAWLEANRMLPIRDYRARFVATHGRDDVSEMHLHSLRKRKGWRTGRTGRFVDGQQPWNHGVPCAPGAGGLHPNAKRTQFRKGERRGVAVRLYKPIGTERITKDGYRQRKVNDDLPLQRRWQLVQRIEWEAANGLIPDGHALKCLDGNKLNTSPSNWEAIPREVLARLNGGRFRQTLAYDDASPELKPAIMAIAKIKHVATTRGKRSA